MTVQDKLKGTCVTCKHWDTSEQERATYTGWKFDGRRACLRIDDDPGDDLASVEGYDGVRLNLMTKPEFGCVLHEGADE